MGGLNEENSARAEREAPADPSPGPARAAARSVLEEIVGQSGLGGDPLGGVVGEHAGEEVVQDDLPF